MTVQRSPATWLSVFSLSDELHDWTPEPEQAVFVDIGGGFGHQCQALKAANRDLKGRAILQELLETLEHVPQLEGIETQAHSFFEAQPVKGTPALTPDDSSRSKVIRLLMLSSIIYAIFSMTAQTRDVLLFYAT